MKKLLLSIMALATVTFGASAMNLKEAFNALSNLPAVSITAPDYNLPVVSEVVLNGQIAAAYNLDAEQILQTGNAALTILNQVPLVYMINGGCNHYVGAFIYTTPNDEGTNDILIVTLSGYKGSMVAMYGQVDDTVKNAICSAPLNIQGDFLSIDTGDIPDVGYFNITLSKAR